MGRRLIGLAAALFVVGLACLSQAQVGQIPNWPPNTFVSGGGGGSIAYVNSCLGGGASSASCTVNLAGANFLVISTTLASTGGNDNIGTTYVPNADCTTLGQDCIRYAYVSPVAGNVTFSATGTCGFCVIIGAGYSGTIGSTIDQTATPGLQPSTSNICTIGATVTPGHANEILISAWAPQPSSAGGTISIDSGFTVRQSTGLVGGTNYGGALADLIQTTATTEQPTFTLNGGPTNSYSVCSIGTFQ